VRHSARLAAAFALLALAGCMSGTRLPEGTAATHLASVPFHPQERWQCGPAALATILEASGLTASPDALVPEVWVPARRGTLAPELLGATRRRGRIPWRLEGGLSELLAELAAGRPVLVHQNLGIAALPRWHYAVVIGMDPAAGEILLRSGRERLRRTPIEVFDRTWARSGRWAMVALRGRELPARLERLRWLEAIAAVEGAGSVDLAHEAWDHWLELRPDDPIARFGRAVTATHLGDLEAAAENYTLLLQRHGEDVRVLNNLAALRGRLGCSALALSLLDRADAMAGDAEREVLAETRAEVIGAPPSGACTVRSP
jgi:hypothetical protein